jgi:hypothetical protein
MTQPLALPAAASGDAKDSARVRARMADIGIRHIGAVTDTVEELEDLGLVPTATVQTRAYGSAPMFKAYVINETEAFFGYYPVVEHEVRADGDKIATFDPMGKDVVLVVRRADARVVRKRVEQRGERGQEVTKTRELVRSAHAVLLDFDGPITPLMPAPANMHAADIGRTALAAHQLDPDEIRWTSDHLAVIRWAGSHAPSALPDVEAACNAAEAEAARTCVPTPGTHDMLVALHAVDIPVVIVTNNPPRPSISTSNAGT